VFTVNYDLLIETALEKLGVAYFDGFVGALHARFRTDLVEATSADSEAWLPSFLMRLWKLHGSVNWAWETPGRADVVRLGSAVATGEVAAIYPSDTKYDESRAVSHLLCSKTAFVAPSTQPRAWLSSLAIAGATNI
jgi:hypothetical protein